MSRVEELMKTQSWVVDILPARVPKGSRGQYFAIEKHFLKEQLANIKQKHVNVILKLNCYMDISVDEEINPFPERIKSIMNERSVFIITGNSMILSEPDDTHMTIFNPDDVLLDLFKTISAGEGLFVWKP
ncbi:hypothetical protein SAMN04487864_1059 [Succiniclasticum ruminis]|uniref:Uncharacterized protein n=1 Tax=Succiniclasticum ruminis TaxID=40841 RepID=A0A1G6KMS1_9FIRM|nr:hypothetical protein [Succiniclasticum ruminis]SDC32412.1 hypothetical protein SAMN04487864_1059 [Succiniclasticum ruminis]